MYIYTRMLRQSATILCKWFEALTVRASYPWGMQEDPKQRLCVWSNGIYYKIRK